MQLAGALAGVILADSLLFASSGVAEEDRRAAESLARIAGIDDIQAFGREILDVKLSLAGLSPEELFSRDFREFLMGGKRIGVPHIECASTEAVAPLKAALAAEVQKAKNDSFHSIFLLLTYVDQRQSELLAVSEDNDALQKAFGPAVTAGGQPASVILPGVMNRKNDIVPRLQAIFIP